MHSAAMSKPEVGERFRHQTPLNGYRWTRLDSRSPNLAFFENLKKIKNFKNLNFFLKICEIALK